MNMKRLTAFVSITLLCAGIARAGEIKTVQLVYKEQEAGIDPYFSRFTISDRYLRIDDLTDDSGYILFDSQAKKIFSVSHYDQSTLVIADTAQATGEKVPEAHIEYAKLSGAPRVSGKEIYSYHVYDSKDETRNKCAEYQIAEGLLPDAARMLREYTRIRSSQQVETLDQVPLEYQTDCFLIDQVFDTGEYYHKGLPIQEWHSNGKMRHLEDIKREEVDDALFDVPQEYRQFSLGEKKAAPGIDGPI